MKAKTTAALLTMTFIASLVQTETAQAASPEEMCFTNLTQAAKSNPAFNSLNLAKVRKINGSSGQHKSEPFSVATYQDFSDAFSTQTPYFSTDLKYFPNQMEEVPAKHKFVPKKHRSNRNNTASIIFQDGRKSFIDHWMSRNGASTELDIRDYFANQKSAGQLNSKYNRQRIDGYYLDTRYVSFGRESDLDFSYPNRAANPANDDFYPTGRPVRDMREYLIYTHHLSPALGGAFVGCELVKMSPRGGFKLKDYNYSGKSLAWENYGGTMMSASNSRTSVVGGGKFRKAEIDYTVNTRQNPNKDLLRFYALSMNYNNNNRFLNTYITSKFFDEEMKSAKGRKTFLEMRRAFYTRVRNSGLLIGKSGFRIPSVDGNEIHAGTFCGIGMSQHSNPIRKCIDKDPRVSCPSGYIRKTWADLGSSGKWSSCFKQTKTEVSSRASHGGLFCGIKMTGKPGDMQRCAGLDPQQRCPAGYDKVYWAKMNANGGDWYSCIKQNNTVADPTMHGTMCGLKMAHQSNPIQTCNGLNPQTSCPEGFTSKRWANINGSWGQWYSCFKDSKSPTRVDDFRQFDAARWNLPGLDVPGKVTYFTTDAATAQKVCEVRGRQAGRHYKKGQWIGGTATASSPGWSYGNLAVGRWDPGSKTFTSQCNTGYECINRRVQYRTKLRCTSYN